MSITGQEIRPPPPPERRHQTMEKIVRTEIPWTGPAGGLPRRPHPSRLWCTEKRPGGEHAQATPKLRSPPVGMFTPHVGFDAQDGESARLLEDKLEYPSMVMKMARSSGSGEEGLADQGPQGDRSAPRRRPRTPKSQQDGAQKGKPGPR